MTPYHYISLKERATVSFVFAVRVSYDRGTWTAYCPALLGRGGEASAGSATAALNALNRRVWDIVICMQDEGEPVPVPSHAPAGPVVVVTTAP